MTNFAGNCLQSFHTYRLTQSASFHIFEFFLGLVIAAGLVSFYIYKSKKRYFDRNRQKDAVEVGSSNAADSPCHTHSKRLIFIGVAGIWLQLLVCPR